MDGIQCGALSSRPGGTALGQQNREDPRGREKTVIQAAGMPFTVKRLCHALTGGEPGVKCNAQASVCSKEAELQGVDAAESSAGW